MAVICHPNPSQRRKTPDRSGRSYPQMLAKLIQMKMHSSMRIQMESHTIRSLRSQENVDGLFELDLTLENNITTEEHPLGVYHPHAEYHHIKKKISD